MEKLNEVTKDTISQMSFTLLKDDCKHREVKNQFHYCNPKHDSYPEVCCCLENCQFIKEVGKKLEEEYLK